MALLIINRKNIDQSNMGTLSGRINTLKSQGIGINAKVKGANSIEINGEITSKILNMILGVIKTDKLKFKDSEIEFKGIPEFA